MIQFVITGWERKAIAEVGPKVVAISTYANRALERVKHHEGALWSKAYRTCVRGRRGRK